MSDEVAHYMESTPQECRHDWTGSANSLDDRCVKCGILVRELGEVADDSTHYMESTSRLKAENEELFEMSQRDRRALEVCRLQRMTAEANRDEWKNQARWEYKRCCELAGLLVELWADESVRAAVGEGDPKGLHARVEGALDFPPAENP